MKIGITGASGFLGSYLLKYLSRKIQYQIYALTRTVSPQKLDACEGVIWSKGDLVSPQDCLDFLDGLDVVIHLAHTNTPLTSNRDIASDALLNLTATLNLLQAIINSNSKPHLIYASSGGAVYQQSQAKVPFKESDPCEPLSSYGILKCTIEQYLRMGVLQGHLTATSLRIGNPYGVLLPLERMQGLIGVALNQIVHQQPVKIFGDPNNVRDYIHLEDMCSIFDLAINHPSGFEVYNVGSGIGYSVNQILDLLEQITNYKVIRSIQPSTQMSSYLPSWIVLDIAKAKKELGWQPKISFEQGLKTLCEKIL